MLLNLDLFAPRPDGSGSGAAGESLFEQIRTLRAMGYLQKRGEADADNANTDAGVPGAQPSPSSPESSYNQGGTQQ